MGAAIKSARINVAARFWRGAHRILLAAEQFAGRHSSLPHALLHESACLLPDGQLHNLAQVRENIKVGARSVIRGELLVFAHGGRIEIGEDCYVGETARIWSAAEVVIGDRVLISHSVNIHDTDSHPMDANERHHHFREIINRGHPTQLSYKIQSAAVHIADDVWIGFGVTILKGVAIGARSVVAAASVVTRDIPAGVLVAGNPARMVRDL